MSGVRNRVVHSRIVIDKYGNTSAVWSRHDGEHMIVQAAVKPFGGIWSAVRDLSDFGEDALSAELAINGSGNLVAVWQRWNGENTVIQASTKPFGNGLMGRIQLFNRPTGSVIKKRRGSPSFSQVM